MLHSAASAAPTLQPASAQKRLSLAPAAQKRLKKKTNGIIPENSMTSRLHDDENKGELRRPSLGMSVSLFVFVKLYYFSC